MVTADFLIIGAGIAGASIGYELAAAGRVIVLERELQAGYHATGRSAALFSEIYGNPVVRALSRASRGFLLDPAQGFSDIPLLRPRGVLYIAAADELADLTEFRAAPDVASHTYELSTQQALELVPILRKDRAVHCAYEPDAMDVEAAGLHQSYLRGLRQRGGRVITNCSVGSLEFAAGNWSVRAGDEVFVAPILVNAAGAWADEIAALAGIRAIGLEPKRRTALLIQPPAGLTVDRWPMVMDIRETFYFKPDAGKLLVSPADETASAPCDAQPDDLDVAVAVDRLEQATTLSVQRVTHRWAGLRSFVADRSPVAGFDADRDGFFWLAGQGGYGFQTAPALSRAAAALVLRKEIPSDIAAHGVEEGLLSSERLERK